MFSNKQKLSYARRWRHYFESLIYVECLSHKRKKIPTLEIADDSTCYQTKGIIHLGVGMIEAESSEDLFEQLHYLLGHELQHMLSSTDKDWNAAHRICFRNACLRLSVRVFGKTRRLNKDSDYEAFFKDFAANNIFVNQNLIATYINFVLNTVEDGRIENIRPKKNPGFGSYKKVFRGIRWQKDDFRDEAFFTEDPDDLDELGKLKMTLGQIYYLSTLGIYQKGFLESYGGTSVHRYIKTFIPDISAAVLGKTCKIGMDHGRAIFDRLLDSIIDVCTIEASAEELQKFLEQLLQKLLDEAQNQELSATPNSEEQGDGLPADSTFGQSELELEVTREEYEELMKDADEEDPESPAVRLKVKEDEDDNSNCAEQESETSDKDSAGEKECSDDTADIGSSPAKGASSNDSDSSQDQSESGIDGDQGDSTCG